MVAKIMQKMFSLRHCGPKNILKFVFCATHNGVVWSLECNLKDTKLKLKQDGDCKWKMKLIFGGEMVGKSGFSQSPAGEVDSAQFNLRQRPSKH